MVGFDVVPQGWLALFAFIPLLGVTLVQRRIPPGEAFAYALVAHLIAYGAAFQWVHFHPMAKTVLASVGGILFLALLGSLPWVGAAWIHQRSNPATALASWSVLVLALEHGLSHGPWALPWTVLSLTQANLPYSGLAATLGAPGLSAIVLATNSTIAYAVHRPTSRADALDRRNTEVVRFPLLALGTLATLIVIGLGLFDPPSRGNPVAESYLRLFQPGISATEWAKTGSLTKAERLLAMTRDSTNAPEPRASSHGQRDRKLAARVWPESALPPAFFRKPDSSHVHRAIHSMRVPLLTGAVRPYHDSTLPAYRRYTNDVLVFQSGDIVAEYSKRHLVPFAEHVPLVDDVPFLRFLTVPAGGVAGYVRGSASTIVEVPSAGGIRIAPLICFETILRPYTRRMAAKQPHVMLAVSQIGWWGKSSVLAQYRALTSLRAIETGLPIIVATVSGPTFTAFPNGGIQTHIRWMQAGTADVAIPDSTWTVYRSLGIWMDAAVMVALFLFVYVATSARER
ncbi:apolipoprotein N-acyltransferase [Longibacter salinarum]|uniref:apolipoprotein N-acyltransferase n=1 Tax=Longibacter salinarum TaxID=1850348 RepID=UPI000BF06A68|nr:apolipoprotein N-acyltransferase [Longibacter salinarum]